MSLLFTSKQLCRILLKVGDDFLSLEQLFNKYRGPEAARIADTCMANGQYVFIVENNNNQQH